MEIIDKKKIISDKSIFSILYAKEGDSLQVCDFDDSAKEEKDQLIAMGLRPGAKISVLKEKSRHGVIINYQNNYLALDSKLAHSLMVSPCDSEMH